MIQNDGTIVLAGSTGELCELFQRDVLVIGKVLSIYAGETIIDNAKTCPATGQPCYDNWCLTTGKCAEND
jgi:hypothetical protein